MRCSHECAPRPSTPERQQPQQCTCRVIQPVWTRQVQLSNWFRVYRATTCHRRAVPGRCRRGAGWPPCWRRRRCWCRPRAGCSPPPGSTCTRRCCGRAAPAPGASSATSCLTSRRAGRSRAPSTATVPAWRSPIWTTTRLSTLPSPGSESRSRCCGTAAAARSSRYGSTSAAPRAINAVDVDGDGALDLVVHAHRPAPVVVCAAPARSASSERWKTKNSSVRRRSTRWPGMTSMRTATSTWWPRPTMPSWRRSRCWRCTPGSPPATAAGRSANVASSYTRTWAARSTAARSRWATRACSGSAWRGWRRRSRWP